MYPVHNEAVGMTVSTVVDSWINSPLHNANMRWDADYMAVAYMVSGDDYGYRASSVIVTFGTQGTEHYFIDGKDMGVFNPDTAPMYGFVVRYTDMDFEASKEYEVEGLGVPYEKWDEYLNSYKTVR
jgi:hypothetical protein